MKKISALILAVICVVTAFASCKKEEPYNPLANGPDTSKKTDEPVAAVDYDIPVVEGLIYDYDLTQYITLPDYTSPDFRYDRYATDEAGLERSLLYTKLLSESVKITKVDRAAQTGDMVVFNYTSTSIQTGENSISGKNVSIILGKEMFAPGFDHYIAGLSAGQSGKFNFTFPSGWTDISALTAKTLEIEVNVTRVNDVVLPSTDQVIEELGLENEEELYRMLKENIDNTNASNMLEAVIEASEVISYPERELNVHRSLFDINAETQAKAMSTTLEGLIATEYSGSMEKFNLAGKEYAEKECKRDLVVYLLQDMFGFELEREEYNLCLEEYFNEYNAEMGLESPEDAYNFMGQALANSMFDDMAAQALYSSVNG